MKKILISILLLVPVLGWGQGRIMKYNGKIMMFNNQRMMVPSWADEIADSYIDMNPHFSTLYAAEIIEYLQIVLDKNYVMPDNSDNYYTVYGPQGQDKKVADFLHYVRFYDSLYQFTLSIPKTGDVMKWQLEDSIYTQNNIPNHQITGTGKGLLTSTDGFSGVNGTVYMGGTNFTGELPNLGFNYNRLFVNSNAYFGKVPDINNSNHDRISIAGNFFTDIEGVSNMLNSGFEQYIATDNNFTESAIEKLFEDFHNYWVTQANAPGANAAINVSGGSSAPPNTTTQGYITAIEAVFDASIYTITITTN
jgi:hypothetical protein